MRAQVSFEYIMTVSFVFLVISALVAGLLAYGQRSSDDIQANQVFLIGSRLSVEAQTVFSEGRDTKSSFRSRLPEIVENISFIENPSDPGGEFVIFLKPMYGHTQSSTIGFPVTVPIEYDPDRVFWGAGLKQFVFHARNNPDGDLVVNVTIQ